MSDQKVYSQNTLSEALACRYPTVWVNSVDLVEVIDRIRAHVGQFPDLSMYMMDILNGLQKYNYKRNRFETVLTIVKNPMTGDPHQVPIYKVDEAIDYTLSDSNATIILPNAEQYQDTLNDIYTSMGLSWRQGWRSNEQSAMTSQVILCSATNPDPPAAVGRYSQTVRIGFPSKEELTQVVAHVAGNMNAEVDVAAIAGASRGLTSFEAASLYQSQLARTGEIDKTELEDITFRRIAERTEMTIIRPNVNLDEVAGAENVKKMLETSKWLRANPDEAAKYGVTKHIHRFLMLGPPGTGKSYLCEGASKFLGLNLVRTGMSHMLSHFHGQSENNIRGMFDQIAALDPVCVWLDEFGRDASGGQSSHLVDAGTTDRMHGIFLTGLQELSDNTYIFAAANNISTLAPEMLRADRFDKIFWVSFPTFSQRYQIISGLLKGREHNVDINKIAAASGSYTGAEIKSAILTASQYGLADRVLVNSEHIIEAMNRDKNRVWLRHRASIQDSIKRALNDYEWASDEQFEEGRTYANGNVPQGGIKSRGEVIKASVSLK